MNKVEKFNILRAMKVTSKEAQEYAETYASRRSPGGKEVGSRTASRKAHNENLQRLAKSQVLKK